MLYFIYSPEWDFETLIFDNEAKAEAELAHLKTLAAYDGADVQILQIDREGLYAAVEAQAV